jgi:hypothetical protein
VGSISIDGAVVGAMVVSVVFEVALVGVIDTVDALISGSSYIYSEAIAAEGVGKIVGLVIGKGLVDTMLDGFVVMTEAKTGIVASIVLIAPDPSIDPFTGFAPGVTTTCSTIVTYPLPVTFPWAFA